MLALPLARRGPVWKLRKVNLIRITSRSVCEVRRQYAK